MCPHKEWFFKFEEVDGGVVYIGSSDVTGMGSIRLGNHDGSIRVLTDVWYVPKLKKNLISLGALESEGLIVIIRNRVLNVISDALSLYNYNGSTVIGVVATVSGSGEDSENTNLWHRFLGPAVGVVSRYRHDPGKGLWQSVKWVLRYLLNTVDVGLVFERDDACDQYAIGFVDSDCAGDLDKWHSTTIYVFTLLGALVS